MERKIFTALFLILLIVVSLGAMALLAAQLINHGGTVGAVVCPFLILGLAYLLVKLVLGVYNRTFKKKVK